MYSAALFLFLFLFFFFVFFPLSLRGGICKCVLYVSTYLVCIKARGSGPRRVVMGPAGCVVG